MVFLYPKVFDGNTAMNTPVTATFPYVIMATKIKVRPTEWVTYIAMRLEIRGCPGKALISKVNTSQKERLHYFRGQ